MRSERVRLGWHLIGYDLPLRRYGVYFAYVAPEPVHVHLGFEWGAFMGDPPGLLQGAGHHEAGPLADVQPAGARSTPSRRSRSSARARGWRR